MRTYAFDNQNDIVEVLKDASKTPTVGGQNSLVQSELIHRIYQADVEPEEALATLMKLNPKLYSELMLTLQKVMGNTGVGALHERVSRRQIEPDKKRSVEKAKGEHHG